MNEASVNTEQSSDNQQPTRCLFQWQETRAEYRGRPCQRDGLRWHQQEVDSRRLQSRTVKGENILTFRFSVLLVEISD